MYFVPLLPILPSPSPGIRRELEGGDIGHVNTLYLQVSVFPIASLELKLGLSTGNKTVLRVLLSKCWGCLKLGSSKCNKAGFGCLLSED